MDGIVSDFTAQGIAIRDVKLYQSNIDGKDFAIPRDVYFNPLTDQLQVKVYENKSR